MGRAPGLSPRVGRLFLAADSRKFEGPENSKCVEDTNDDQPRAAGDTGSLAY